jgi:hypothetical protein
MKDLRAILASEGLVEKQATGTFRYASPFGHKLMDLFGPLMGAQSRVFVKVGKEEFSGKVGLLVGVASPDSDLFPEDLPMEGEADPFGERLREVEKALEGYFGAPVTTGLTEESAVIFLVEFPREV